MPMLARTFGSIPICAMRLGSLSIFGSSPMLASTFGSIPIMLNNLGSGAPLGSNPMLASTLGSIPLIMLGSIPAAASIFGSMPATKSADLADELGGGGKALGSSWESILASIP